MSSELSSQPEQAPGLPEGRLEDEPIDAVVYDVHPALVPQTRDTTYPYGSSGVSPFQVRQQDVYQARPIFRFDFEEAPAEYVVPQRFGLSAILGMTTALAILFGCMRWLGAEPGWYLFYGLQSIVICLVQMFHGKAPRKASAVAGAIMGPLFLLGTAWFSWQDRVDPSAVLCLMVMMVPLGAFLGYLNGTCAAGIFLVMDKLEHYLQGEPPAEEPAPPPSALPVS